jgi:hypothetical protein
MTIPRDIDWLPDDQVEMWIGTENAADLANSTPAGGALATSQSPWPGGAGRGGWGAGTWGDFVYGSDPEGFGYGDAGVVWGYGAWGVNLAPPIEVEHDYYPADKCALLPVGVRIKDPAGNRSAVVEDLLQLADPPRGIRNLAAAATGNPNEVQMSFTESPDVI